MTSEGVVKAYFAGLNGEVSQIAHELCRRIGEIGPHLSVSMARGHPCWTGNERVVSVVAYVSHCNLQLWSGARLAQDFSRIEGTGKTLRHVKLRRHDEIDEAIDDIIEAAIDLDRMDRASMR